MLFFKNIVSFSSIDMVCELFSRYMTFTIGFQCRGPCLFVFKHFCAINIDRFKWYKNLQHLSSL